jgi:Glycyl-tRNA synthetase beta subunit
VPELLQRLRLSHSGVCVEGTPRRLAVLVSGLAARQEDAENRLRGPPAKVRGQHGRESSYVIMHNEAAVKLEATDSMFPGRWHMTAVVLRAERSRASARRMVCQHQTFLWSPTKRAQSMCGQLCSRLDALLWRCAIWLLDTAGHRHFYALRYWVACKHVMGNVTAR